MSPKDKNEKSSPTPSGTNINNNKNNSNNNNSSTPKLLVNDIALNINKNEIVNEIDSDDSDFEIENKSSVLFVSPSIVPVNKLNISSVSSGDINSLSPIQSDDMSEGDFDTSIEEEDEEPPCLVDYSDQMVSIAIPVFITMIIVAGILRSFSFSDNRLPTSNVRAVSQKEVDSTVESVALSTMINSFIFLGVLSLSTIIMVVLYKFKFMKALYGWLMATSILLLGVFGGFLFLMVLTYLNFPLDYITFIFVLWNFSAGGIVCIFWFCPKFLNQAYLVCLSAFLALFLGRFPTWTTWSILVLVSIYDIFAVLCPGGPLQQLIDTAKRRGETVPALIYNASVFIGMANDDTCIEMTTSPVHSKYSKNINQNSLQPSPFPTPTSIPINIPSQSEMIEPKCSPNSESISTGVSTSDLSASQELMNMDKGKGIKLGLGDFVFYSVLVGRAAYKDISVVFTCIVAILTGLFLTLLLLAIYKRALPALPISIALGILYYFLSDIFMTPFLTYLSLEQIFI